MKARNSPVERTKSLQKSSAADSGRCSATSQQTTRSAGSMDRAEVRSARISLAVIPSNILVSSASGRHKSMPIESIRMEAATTGRCPHPQPISKKVLGLLGRSARSSVKQSVLSSASRSDVSYASNCDLLGIANRPIDHLRSVSDIAIRRNDIATTSAIVGREHAGHVTLCPSFQVFQDGASNPQIEIYLA